MQEPLVLVLSLRTSHFTSVDQHSFPRHAIRFFWIDNGIIKCVLCLICSVNKTLQRLDLSENQICDDGAASIGGALLYVKFYSQTHVFSACATYFFGLIRDIVKVCLCLICSQNKTLEELYLRDNQIGDAGAVSIGGALAYITFSSFEWTFLHKDVFFGATRFFWIDKHNQIVSDLQPKQDVADVVAFWESYWRCWRCLDWRRLGVRWITPPKFFCFRIYTFCMLFGHIPDFSGLITGRFDCFSRLICSQNNTLKALTLGANRIGYAGAASIGGALVYVILSH
jgi:hypothetical protein